ncbi:MAG TPA: multicopper oxidase domain-containing protein [Baekduia sp.]|uniref:multicopper oxidase domain-containing protein n=1 Tax=Baekduia sp. TaxID=2600305 RepID=UPI002B8AC0B0|nr:multicopper oxidase domain-containing protein [Baekduia sp.]HMJ36243.1 multicopper oxidase domain-containing protein [Baekduia sp.]
MSSRRPRALLLIALIAGACALGGAGTAVAAPTGMVCQNGTSFDLTARSGYVETPDGNSVFMWGYARTGGAFQMPGPVLCVNEGDTVTVTLHNALAEPVSIVFPGQRPVSTGGGDPGLLARQAPPGGQVQYSFTADRPGTYLYESGTDPAKQVEMGLAGVLVVRPSGHPDWAYGSADTEFSPQREYLIMMSEIDPDLHNAVETGATYDITKLHNRYFTINGRSFPDTIQDNGVPWLPAQPYGALVRVKPYDATSNPRPALIRMVNAGLLNHPFHPHGNHLRMIAQDGRRFLTPSGGDASSEHFGETVPAGSTTDMLFSWTDQDKYSPTNPLPVTIPGYNNLAFKDGDTWYSGSPYLGYKGTLPATVRSQNVCGEHYFPWHSHALNEFTNFDAGFGGLATLLRVDPPAGCMAVPASTKIVTGSLKGGTYASLATDDSPATYYEVNSTTVAPRRTEWYAGFTGVPAGFQNLKVSYKGRSSSSCTQTVAIWRWATSAWVQLDTRAVGASDVSIANLSPPAPQSDFRGTGASAGQVRVRIACSGPAVSFSSSGTSMNLVYDAP